MSLIVRIEEELATAMRERDAERRDALRLILSQPALGGEGAAAAAARRGGAAGAAARAEEAS